MEEAADYERIVYLSTDKGDDIQRRTNELLADGYKLLHVGTETSRDRDGNPSWHSTVAVLGRPRLGRTSGVQQRFHRAIDQRVGRTCCESIIPESFSPPV